jgi:serine/threonine-protein kinase
MEDAKTVLIRTVGNANAELDSMARLDLEPEVTIERALAERPGALTYLARENGAKRQVVLRVRERKPLEEAGLLGSLQSSLADVAALTHPSIVPIYGFGVTEHTVWWTTQFVHAPSLADVLRSDGRLSLERTIRLAARVADALRVAHDRGIAHGDVSAGNLLLRNPDWVVLRDFVRPEAWLPTIARIEAAKQSPDNDQRALAITIYRCLTGDADRPAAGLLADLASAASLGARLPELSPSAVMALVRAADHEPSRQFTSGIELVAALQAPPPPTNGARAGGLHPPIPVPEDEPEPVVLKDPNRRRVWLTAGTAVGLLLIGLLFTRWIASAGSGGVPARLASRDVGTPPPPGPKPLARGPAPAPVPARPVDSVPSVATTPVPVPAPLPARVPVDSSPVLAAAPEPVVEAVPPPKVERASRRTPAMPPGFARLSISSVPGGSLYIDNRLIGPTPRRVPLTPGRHVIRITRPGYRRYLSMIEVSPGEERRLSNLILQRVQ